MVEPNTNNGGGSGGCARFDEHALTRYEIKTLERAVRKSQFNFSEVALEQVPAELERIATCSRYERNKIAAARVLVAMAAHNLKEYKQSGDGHKLDVHVGETLTLEERRARLMEICRAALQRAGDGEGAGAVDGQPERNGTH